MQALLANMMQQTLSTKIGEEVSCVSYESGEMIEYRGILKQVLPFNGIQIDEDFIPFVSHEQVIHEIIHVPENQSLYMNPDTLGYIKDEFEEPDMKYKK